MEQRRGPAPPVEEIARAAAPWSARVRAELRTGGRLGAVLALLAAVVAVLAAGRDAGPAWATPATVLAAASGAVLAVIDVRTHRLPDAVVLPAWAGAALLLGASALASADGALLVRGLVGGAVAFCAYAALRLAYPPGLGFGDVKLAGMLGTALAGLGWAELLVGLAAPFLLGGVWSLLLLVTRRAHRGTAVPFGPFMVLGAGVGALAGGAVVAAYALG
ncbi:prepilin peptidase [Cellulosimicrobium terreum]|nr:prepilin peptidase [Cellulosimicrobium terreum]